MKKTLVFTLALAIGVAVIGYLLYPILQTTKQSDKSDAWSESRAHELKMQASTNIGEAVYHQAVDAYGKLLPQQKEASVELSATLSAIHQRSRSLTNENRIRGLEYFKSSGLEKDFIKDQAKDPKSWSIQRSGQLIKESQHLLGEVYDYLQDPDHGWFLSADIELPKVLEKMEKHRQFLRLLYGQSL